MALTPETRLFTPAVASMDWKTIYVVATYAPIWKNGGIEESYLVSNLSLDHGKPGTWSGWLKIPFTEGGSTPRLISRGWNEMDLIYIKNAYGIGKLVYQRFFQYQWWPPKDIGGNYPLGPFALGSMKK